MTAKQPFVQWVVRSPSEIGRLIGPPIALLSLAVWATFGQAIHNGLVFDDLDTIKYNTTIASWKNLSILFSKDYFQLSDEYTYRPIVTLSYFIDHAIGGKKPLIYHLHNLALHHANVLLVFTLFYLLGAGRWRSFAIALIFALHPLHTEAIIFPGFREDLQMTLGMLAMSCCLAADRNQPTSRWVLLAPVAFAYALFAKEGALALPVAWLAFDAIQNPTERRRFALGRRYVLLVFVLIVYVVIRFFVMANPAAADMDVIDRLPLKQRLITAPYLFAYYVRRFFWPAPLSIIHEVAELKEIGPAFHTSLFIIGAVTLVWIAVALREKWLWLAGLWVIASFAPVANVYQIVNLWAERFYYAVGIGTAAIVVAGIGALWDFLSKRIEPNRRFAFAAIAWLLVILVVWAAAVYDLIRVSECRTSLSLWRATVRCVPTNGTALATLAIAELEAGDSDRAEQFAREAEQYGGGVYRANYILGQVAFRRQKWDKAIEHFEKALTVPPPSISSRTTLVLCLTQSYLNVGQPQRAATLLRQGIEWDSENRALRDLLRKIETKPQDTTSTSPAVEAEKR
jgi:tetratricopeptide (TPR) repeat protein